MLWCGSKYSVFFAILLLFHCAWLWIRWKIQTQSKWVYWISMEATRIKKISQLFSSSFSSKIAKCRSLKNRRHFPVYGKRVEVWKLNGIISAAAMYKPDILMVLIWQVIGGGFAVGLLLLLLPSWNMKVLWLLYSQVYALSALFGVVNRALPYTNTRLKEYQKNPLKQAWPTLGYQFWSRVSTSLSKS